MKKNTGRKPFVLVMAVMLALTWGFTAESGPGWTASMKVSASQPAGQTRQIHSLAEFRSEVAASVSRIAGHISRKLIAGVGSASGRLITEDGDGSGDRSSGSGDKTAEKSTEKKYDPYNVYDYDSADDFADDYVYEFAEEYYDDENAEDAYDDAYDEACDYWESHHK